MLPSASVTSALMWNTALDAASSGSPGEPIHFAPSYDSEREIAGQIVYSDPEGNSFENEQSLLEQGIRLVHWEYPDPIENSFVFSHISYLTGQSVIPFVLIAAAVLLMVLIFVKSHYG